MEGIANREYTMAALLKQIIRRYQMKLQKYQITIVNYDPRFQLQEQKMRLSELEEQIQQVMKNKMTGYKHKLELYAKRTSWVITNSEIDQWIWIFRRSEW